MPLPGRRDKETEALLPASHAACSRRSSKKSRSTLCIPCPLSNAGARAATTRGLRLLGTGAAEEGAPCQGQGDQSRGSSVGITGALISRCGVLGAYSEPRGSATIHYGEAVRALTQRPLYAGVE